MSERWDRRYAERSGPLSPPDEGVVALTPSTPGKALDLAGGDGRHAAWLMEQGWDVTLVDSSSVGVARAAQRIPGLNTLQVDLEKDPFPTGSFDLVLMAHYYQPSLFQNAAQCLAPGGHLLFVQPTLTNLERHPRPSARFLVDPVTYEQLAGELMVVHASAEWRENDRHTAWLLAQRR